jgi:hypothetical protein
MWQIRTPGSSCRNRFGLDAIADIAVSTAATNLSVPKFSQDFSESSMLEAGKMLSPYNPTTGNRYRGILAVT